MGRYKVLVPCDSRISEDLVVTLDTGISKLSVYSLSVMTILDLNQLVHNNSK